MIILGLMNRLACASMHFSCTLEMSTIRSDVYSMDVELNKSIPVPHNELGFCCDLISPKGAELKLNARRKL